MFDRVRIAMTLMAAAVALLALPLSAHASEPAPPAPALTWRGRPLAETRSFMITEFGVLSRIDDYPYLGGDSRLAFSFDLGWMKNISEKGAVGLSGYALVSDPV